MSRTGFLHYENVWNILAQQNETILIKTLQGISCILKKLFLKKSQFETVFSLHLKLDKVHLWKKAVFMHFFIYVSDFSTVQYSQERRTWTSDKFSFTTFLISGQK